MSKQDDFRDELLEAFTAEGHDQIHNILQALLMLEASSNEGTRMALLETAYKEVHNLKGSARGVQFLTIESFCHPLESILYALKRGIAEPTPELMDLLLLSLNSTDSLFAYPEAKSLDAPMQKLLNQLKAAANTFEAKDEFKRQNVSQESEVVAPSPITHGESNSAATNLEKDFLADRSLSQSKFEESGKAELIQARKSADTLRIAVSKLDLVMQKAEEMLAIKLMLRQQAAEAKILQEHFSSWTRQWTKVATALDAMSKQVQDTNEKSVPAAFQVLDKLNPILASSDDNLKSLAFEIDALVKTSNNFSYFASNSFDSLLDETKHLLMMPCANLFSGFYILVRELARELKKDVDLIISGDEIEIDKRILNELKDPLTHALRNSLDHGIERPEERDAQGKPRRARLILSVEQIDAGTIEIRVSDDGRGVDVQKIKTRAIEIGLNTADELSKMSDEAIKQLIFKSSFSTRDVVTEISGRGIGLSVLEENVRKLGGRVRLESTEKQGTSFCITLPVSITTFRGVLVEVMERMFVIPTKSVERVVRVQRNEVKLVDGLLTVLLEGSLVPLCHMQEILKLPKPQKNDRSEFFTVGVLGNGEERVGLIVDSIVEELEVLVKPLDAILASTPNITGLTILGSGKVVPIINVTDILKNSQPAFSRSADLTERRSKRQAKILVADDTLTARMLLRNIIEKAGFSVKTANDGVDALAALKRESPPFDLLITDLEMPRMNGFELTAAVRKDEKVRDLPVIIVTSKTTKEDRQRGVAVGANAYFVKSSFEQTNLVDVISSLVES